MKKIHLKRLLTWKKIFLVGKRNHVGTTAFLLLQIFIVGGSSGLSAMTFNEPFAYVTSTKPGVYFFKMVPAKKITDCQGFTYRVKNDGTLEEVWQTRGWYSFTTYLTPNGETLIRIDEGCRENFVQSNPIITFYRQGKEIYRYTIVDLGLRYDDVKFEEQGVTLYTFIEKISGFLSDKCDMFEVVLINKNQVVFNVQTGKIIKFKDKAEKETPRD
jgi:hypothetical protein